MEPVLFVLIALIAFVGGVVVTAVGPGGIFVVVSLYALTSLPAAVIAGTSSVTFIGGSVLGAAGYGYSDDMNWVLALIIGVSGAIGTRLGVFLNGAVSRQLFGILLGLLLGVVGVTILMRECGYLDRFPTESLSVVPASAAGIGIFGGIGLTIGTAGGLFGIGGAALVPPALVLVGVPMIAALAVTQIAVVFIASASAVSYVLQDAIAVPLVFIVAITYLMGALAGWRLAKHINPNRLTAALGVVLLGLTPVLVYRSIAL
jgi:uncharacterized membrane protein YfcA